jgi:hypothetical protein
MWSPAELSRLGVLRIAPELVSALARQRLMTLRDFGPRATHFAAFECRLDGRDEQVDVSFALEGPAARAAVRYWLSSSAERGARDDTHPHIRALLRAWAADSGLLTEIGSMWLEFDLVPGSADSAFLYFRPQHRGQFWQHQHAPLVRPFLDAWAFAAGGAENASSCERLARCIAALPDGARVLLLAPQLRSANDAIRMSFRLSADRLPSYLARIGWPGPQTLLAEQLRACKAQHWAMPIQLDIVEGELSPWLSLEFTQSSENRRAERCEPVLQSWTGDQICTEQKAAAVLRWRYDERPCEDDDVFDVAKLLDLKLTIDRNGRLRSKAYLGTLGINRYFQRGACRNPELSPRPNVVDG